MSTETVDIRAEETGLYDVCTRSSAAIFKFFDMFRVEFGDEKATTATVYFGKSYEDDEVPVALAKQIRSYAREQKKAIRDNPHGFTGEEGRQKIFWLISMLIQHGVFSSSAQSKIMTYGSFVFHETKEDD
jgi:hypothetical protein